MTQRVPVKVSAAMARQEFAGCSPDYIAQVCQARCCRAPSRPTGIMVTIHRREVASIERAGGVVQDGMLQPAPGTKRCPFQDTDTHLCGLHGTTAKPLGCIASPFTLNANGTLVVRNRYRLLPCYKDGARLPAYKAFRDSLVLLFGTEQTDRLTAHLDAGGGDMTLTMARVKHAMLLENDVAKKPKPKDPPAPAIHDDVRRIPLDDLTLDPNNANRHPPEQIANLVRALQRWGQRKVLVVQRRDDGTLLVRAGSGTVQALREAGATDALCQVIDEGDQDATGYGIADNRIAKDSYLDQSALAALLPTLDQVDLGVLGMSDDELAELTDWEPADGKDPPRGRVSLADRFGVPPFTVLDARQGWWQDRKRAWLALGIQSELGRGDDMAIKSQDSLNAIQHGGPRPGHGKRGTTTRQHGDDYAGGDAWAGKDTGQGFTTGTSIFDPVLAELALRWFCPPQGKVLDPYAGGSVRGIVTCAMGRMYWGVDLRGDQVAANEVQRDEIVPKLPSAGPPPQWTMGDCQRKLAERMEADHEAWDMVLTCPPYGRLERYSDHQADLSAMDNRRAAQHLREVARATYHLVRPDSFAVWVVGDYREDHALQDFPGEVIRAHRDAGWRLYNDAVLVTPVGSLMLRAGRQFTAGRKLGRTHQQVLVFIKGDHSRATKRVGPVQFGADDGPQEA